MSTSRSAIALAVLPTVAAGLVVLPVVTWNETVTVGTTPDPTTYALAAYTAGADDEPAGRRPTGDAERSAVGLLGRRRLQRLRT